MKKLLLISSLIAAASVPAFADVELSTTATTVGTAVSTTLGDGETYTVSGSSDYTVDGVMLLYGAWAGNSTGGFTGKVTGTGTLEIYYNGGNGSETYNVTISGADFSEFSGQLSVLNHWNRPAIVHIGGETFLNTEYLFPYVSREKGWTISRTDNASLWNDTLNLTSDTKLAGITGTSQGYALTSGGTSTNAYEFITATTSGTTLAIVGNTAGSAYAFYGTVGTNSSTISLEKSGASTQTFGGTNYLNTVKVLAGTLALAGTTTIADAVTVTGGELSLAGTTDVKKAVSVTGGKLSTAGTTSFAGTVSVGSGATLSLGGTIELSSAVTGAGNVTVNSGAIFVLSDSLKTSGEAADRVYQLFDITGTLSGFTAGEDALTNANFIYDGETLSARKTISISGGSVTVSGTAYELYWKATSSADWATASSWGKDSTSGDDTAFVDLDNVHFTSDATVTVNSAATTAGTMTISDGVTVTISSGASNLSFTSATVGSGAVLDLGTLDSYSANINGAGTVKIASSGYGQTFVLGSDFTGTAEISGNFQITNTSIGTGTLKVLGNMQVSGQTTYSGNVIFTNSGTATTHQLHTNGGTTMTFSGDVTIDSDSTLNKHVTNGTLNFTGDLTVNGALGFGASMGGTIAITPAANKTLTVAKGATLSATTLTFSTAGSSAVFNGNATFSGAISTANGGSSNGGITIAEGATLTAGSFSNGWGMSSLVVDGVFDVSAGTFKIATGSTTNEVSGTGTIKAQALTIGNLGTYNISVNRIEVGSGGIAASDVYTNYTLNLSGTTIATSDSWDTSSANNTAVKMNLVSGTTTTFEINNVEAADGTTTETTATLAGVISGAGNLTKTGTGTLVLSANNTYTGNTTVEAGEVKITGTASFSDQTTASIASSAKLTLGAGTSFSTITGEGEVVFDGTYTFGVSGSFTNTLDANTVTVNDGATLQLRAWKAYELSVSNLYVNGTLKNEGSHSGATNATLAVGSNQTIGGAGTVELATTISGTATLDVKDGNLTFTNGVTFADGAKVLIDSTMQLVMDVSLEIVCANAITFATTGTTYDLTNVTGTQDITDVAEMYFDDIYSDYYWLLTNNGTNLVLTMSSIPEPSMFGLLAGTLALALAGTRRRRKNAK